MPLQRAWWLALSAVMVAAPVRAWAQADDAVRQEVLAQAEQADRAGDHARALDLATRAGRMSMTPSVRFFIAQQEAALGRTAEALNDAMICQRDVASGTAVRNRAFFQHRCSDLETSMRSRIGRVVLHVPTPTPSGLRVRISGREVSDAFFGIPYLVSPGEVPVEASAPGQGSFRSSLEVAVGQTVEVNVALTNAAPAPTGVPPPGQPVSPPMPQAGAQPGAVPPPPMAAPGGIPAGMAMLRILGPMQGVPIYVDGQNGGVTPVSHVIVSPGLHNIVVSAPGRAPQHMVIIAVVGQLLVVDMSGGAAPAHY
jgi:hypothetical protein